MLAKWSKEVQSAELALLRLKRSRCSIGNYKQSAFHWSEHYMNMQDLKLQHFFDLLEKCLICFVRKIMIV